LLFFNHTRSGSLNRVEHASFTQGNVMVRRTIHALDALRESPVKTADTLRTVRATSPKAARSSATCGAAFTFKWSVRVYYEDTDAGGVVYYANYLKYFERCRTEWLRALGVDQSALTREQGLQFVVARIEAEYLRPAGLDDELVIYARALQIGHCSILFEQFAQRGDQVLVRAQVTVACVDAQRRRPARLPEALRARIRPSGV
jgi:acyl-CoA thioester hydrolase